MKKTDRIQSFDTFFPFVPLPAMIIGVYTMIYFGVPTYIWLINLTIVCLGVCLALLVLKYRIHLIHINPLVVLVVTLILLLGTFYDSGVMNAHRWINLNSFQINIGLLVSPLILIQISRISNRTIAVTWGILTTLIFLIQPDASLVSAFSISVFIILYRKDLAKIVNVSLLFFFLFMIGYSWYHLDSLEPVSYVESIINLTREISMPLFFASIFSLLLLIFPFIYYSDNNDLSLPLGIYFLVLLLSTLVGDFPVMVMGYGVSPIMGYFIGLIWQINTKSHLLRKENKLFKSHEI